MLEVMHKDLTSTRKQMLQLFQMVQQQSQELKLQSELLRAQRQELYAQKQYLQVNAPFALFVFGGWNRLKGSLNTMEYFTPMNNSWRALSPLPEPLEGFGCCFGSGRIFVSGGYASTSRDGKGACLTSCLMYDPLTYSWAKMPSLPKPLTGHCSVFLDNFVYALGGVNRSTVLRLPVGIIPTTPERGGEGAEWTSQWQKAAKMAIPRAHAAAVAANRKIYVFGGAVSAGR